MYLVNVSVVTYEPHVHEDVMSVYLTDYY